MCDSKLLYIRFIWLIPVLLWGDLCVSFCTARFYCKVLLYGTCTVGARNISAITTAKYGYAVRDQNVLVGFVCLQIVHSATSRDVRERTCFRVRHTDHRVEHIPVGTAISEGFLGDKFVSGLNLVKRRQRCLFYLKPLLVMQYLKWVFSWSYILNSNNFRWVHDNFQ